jgi:hypothetical protein
MSAVEDNRKSSKLFWSQQKKQMMTMMRRSRNTIPKLSPAIDEMENFGRKLLLLNIFGKSTEEQDFRIINIQPVLHLN